jgi:hypothetical protein
VGLFLFHWSLCVSLYQYHTVVIIVLTFRLKKPSNFILFFCEDILAILSSLHFHEILGLGCQILLKKKKGSRGFDRDYFEYVYLFGDFCHLNSVKSAIHECKIYFCIFRFLKFLSMFYIFQYTYTSFIRFIMLLLIDLLFYSWCY